MLQEFHQGSPASVFKGILNDKTSVTVKRIYGEERGEREFRSEVSAISSVQHVNLVRLFYYRNSPTYEVRTRTRTRGLR